MKKDKVQPSHQYAKHLERKTLNTKGSHILNSLKEYLNSANTLCNPDFKKNISLQRYHKSEINVMLIIR